MNHHVRSVISRLLLGALTGFVTQEVSPEARGATPDDANWEVMSAQLPGVDGRIDAFASVGGRLYAGGRFRIIGGLVTSGVAAWDGTRWSALGGGVDGAVSALLVRGSDLIAAGDFTSAGGVPAINVARWDGVKWNAMGSLSSQPAGNVLALAEFNREIYAGGDFQTASGKVANGIARWRGTSWESLDQGVRGGRDAVYAISSVTTNLYVGGDFIEVGGDPWNPVRGLARWFDDNKKGKWRSLNVPQVSVRTLRGHEDRLFVGGRFSGIGTATSRNVEELTADGDWIGFGPGVSSANLSDVAAIEPFGSDIFCGGFFEMAGNQPIPSIARWTGTGWLPAGGGIDLGLNQGSQVVKAVGSKIYVLGGFRTAGRTIVSGAAEWTGAGWLAMGSGIPQWDPFHEVKAATDGRDLYVSIDFRPY